MAAEHEQVRRPHQLLDSFMGDSSQQVHSAAKLEVRGDSRLNVVHQRRRAEATEQLQFRQLSCGGTDAFQDRERVLVGVQVSDPKNGRIAFDAGHAARFLPIPGRKAARGFRDFIQLRFRVNETGIGKRARLLQGAKRESCGDRHLQHAASLDRVTRHRRHRQWSERSQPGNTSCVAGS